MANLDVVTWSGPLDGYSVLGASLGKLLLTGGIGDVITVESYMAPAFRESLHSLYLATPQADNIKTLFEALPAHVFPNLESIEVIPVDFSPPFNCIVMKQQLWHYLACKGQRVDWLAHVADGSIIKVFADVRSGKLQYQGSSFASNYLAELPALPTEYAAIHPASVDNVQQRSFTDQDWDATRQYLKQQNLRGVVIGRNVEVPHGFINMVGKTSIPEAVEIVRRAKAYVGIDSYASVIASKVLTSVQIKVKSLHQRYLLPHAAIYYAPHKDISFISDAILC